MNRWKRVRLLREAARLERAAEKHRHARWSRFWQDALLPNPTAVKDCTDRAKELRSIVAAADSDAVALDNARALVERWEKTERLRCAAKDLAAAIGHPSAFR